MMLTKLPSPITIIYCLRCDDVTTMRKDHHGIFCSVCLREPEDMKPKKVKQ